VDRGDVKLLTMYGRIYCAHVDKAAGQLMLYRFYRDALIHQHTFPLYSQRVALSAVDHALLVHNLDSGVVLVQDVLSSSKHPLASPLPLGLPPHIVDEDGVPKEEAPNLEPYSDNWDFVGTDMIVDWTHGAVWHQRLDLAALTTSCSDRTSLVGFLQRRRQDLPYASPASSPHRLTLQVVKALIADRESLASISRAFDLLCGSYQEALLQAQQVGGREGGEAVILPRNPAVSPVDMVKVRTVK
jgi:hypothetical protein